MHRQPQTRWFTRGLHDPMGGVGGDEAVIPGGQAHGCTCNPERRLALEQAHPFILRLVITSGIGAVSADDALDLEIATPQQILKGFASLQDGEFGKQVAGEGRAHVSALLQQTATGAFLAFDQNAVSTYAGHFVDFAIFA